MNTSDGIKKHITVQLDGNRLEKVKELKSMGFNISHILRDAIDNEFNKLIE